jgi:hypothetical protein
MPPSRRYLPSCPGTAARHWRGDLGLTAEQASDLAHDPDFKRMVAEEAAKLTAQRSE